MSYFLRHPEAADSLEGIARWRLLRETTERKVDETFAALQFLMEQGFVEEIHTGAGDSVFRLIPEKRLEMEKILESKSERLKPE